MKSWQRGLAAALMLMPGPSVCAVDYRMEAALDTTRRIISGREIVTWTNRTDHSAQDLQFHLYFNAWRNAGSSFLNSNRMLTRSFDEWREDEWAYTRVSRFEVLDGEDAGVDLTDRIEYIQPDDGNPQDRTVMRVALPRPLEPQATIRIRIEFQTKVPRPFARTGRRGRYYFIAHWFPKLGVFEETGTWNCHQFIQTEFFSEFGSYDVRLTLPAPWVVGATGRLQERRDNGDGTATHHYTQDRVHGFAWTASPHFVEFRERFEHPSLAPVDMRLLMMPDHIGQQDRYFAATRAALRYYGEWFGEYPYGHLTIIDPAYGSRSGGMEYPTLFTGGTRWLQPAGSGSPEGVTVHEAGHQFWYGIVANNEFEHAWLDEGFNTYSTRRVMLQVYGSSPHIRRYLDGLIPVAFRDIRSSARTVSGLGGYSGELKLDQMSIPSWRQGPAAVREGDTGRRVYGSGAYGVNSYTKPALMLLTLERFLGWETFQKVMSTYFQRWKFRHPRPRDFFDAVNEVAGRDLSWFWDETYYGSNVFDYAVDHVQPGEKHQSVVLRRWGEAAFPIQVRLTFENGDSVLEQWDGRSRWARFGYDRQDEIVRVEVDPERVLALDANWTNNSWQRQAASKFAGRKWALKWMVWLQQVMELFVFFS